MHVIMIVQIGNMCTTAHAVVAADDNGDLQAFVKWIKHAKKVPNATKLVTTKMPKGRGRKGNAPPCKRKKKKKL